MSVQYKTTRPINAAAAETTPTCRQGLWGVLFICVACIATLVGCQAPMKPTPSWLFLQGELAEAREEVYRDMETDRSQRAYLLDQMRLASLLLDDGYAESSSALFADVYDFLRTQGINDDKTVASVVFYEGVRIWKGEPFEQALAMTYYGLAQASLGSWDNLRAAANQSLFTLRDFSDSADSSHSNNEAQGDLTSLDLAQQAVRAEEQGNTDYLQTAYVPRESDYVLGYLLSAISNLQLDRPNEADENFARVHELQPNLQPLVQTLRDGQYNAILVVGYGMGPKKQSYGPDQSLTRFTPRTPSGGDLSVQWPGESPISFKVVTDVNRMAASHRWLNLEDVRKAKSTLGSALLYGGLGAVAIGAAADSNEAIIAGAAAAAAGLIVKASAQADLRYADTFPQRFYIVPLELPKQAEPILLRINNDPSSELSLLGLKAPQNNNEVLLRYVRLPGGRPNLPTLAEWGNTKTIWYSNPYTLADDPDHLPYIFGGKDVDIPNDTAVMRYAEYGQLSKSTPADLRNYYRELGITWDIESHAGYAPRHLLEGGKSLVSPLPGTLGYTRLFGQLHPPYRQPIETNHH